MGKNQTPEVSICIPAYNQTTYLKILLDSIAGQTFTDYEIIISDDSTTLDVKNLVNTFPFGQKVAYFKNNPSLGSPANWNAAIQKASGRFIKIMHHDDAFNSDTALEQMISFAKSNDYDYVFCDSGVKNIKNPSQNRIHKIKKFKSLSKKPYLLFFGNSIGGPSSLIIKNEVADLQYDPNYIWLVDIEFYIRLLESKYKGNTISHPLVLTHDATDHRLTTSILKDFDLQIKEQAMLYNYLLPKTTAILKFFMQAFLARLCFKSRTNNKNLLNHFVGNPALLKIYFSSSKIKPLYFAYKTFIKVSDICRKILFR